jgi:hypothetical protein
LHHSQGTKRAQAKMSRALSEESKKSDAISTTIPSIARNMRVNLPGKLENSPASLSRRLE